MRSVLVTGASSGIGKHMSGVLARRGWVVWAGCRDEGAHGELRKVHANVRPLIIDVTDSSSIDRARETIERSGVPLNAVVNNAGIGLGGPLEVLDVNEIQKVYDVNVLGYIRIIQVFLPHLRQTAGRIVNMSSLAGLIGIPFAIPYSSSKFAVEGMSDGLRRELSRQHISVSLIEPGPIDTAIWEKSLRRSFGGGAHASPLLKLYTPRAGSFEDLMRRVQKHALPVVRVEGAVVHALESPRPKIRYTISRRAALTRLFLRMLPERTVDFLVCRYLT